MTVQVQQSEDRSTSPCSPRRHRLPDSFTTSCGFEELPISPGDLTRGSCSRAASYGACRGHPRQDDALRDLTTSLVAASLATPSTPHGSPRIFEKMLYDNALPRPCSSARPGGDGGGGGGGGGGGKKKERRLLALRRDTRLASAKMSVPEALLLGPGADSRARGGPRLRLFREEMRDGLADSGIAPSYRAVLCHWA